jgi:transcriptional regulator with XRE-family HTH domain
VQRRVAQKFKNLRLLRDLSRRTLAEQSGVAESSIKHFETLGEISLKSLLRLALVLEALDQFSTLFEPPVARSLEEIEKRDRIGIAARKRGRK